MPPHDNINLSIIGKELVGVMLLFLGLVIALSLGSFSPCDSNWLTSSGERSVGNIFGKFGASLSHALYFLFGYLAWGWVAVITFVGVSKIRSAINPRYVKATEDQFHLSHGKAILLRACFGLFIILGASALAAMHVATNPDFLPNSSGGIVGLWLATSSASLLSSFGATTLFYLIILTSLFLALSISVVKTCNVVGSLTITYCQAAFARISSRIASKNQLLEPPDAAAPSINPPSKPKAPFEYIKASSPAPSPPSDSPPEPMEPPEPPEPLEPLEPPEPPPPLQPPPPPPQEPVPIQTTLVTNEPFMTTDSKNPRELIPPLSLLDPVPVQQTVVDEVMLQQLARLLEQKLKEFGVQARVVSLQTGPVITLFELELGAGVKVSKISGLERDLARSLSVLSVRVLEVIPGKSVIGLEVPNPVRQNVYFTEMLTSDAYSKSKAILPLALGKDIGGTPIIADLASMPHLLVAGTTGAGKSVGINGMLLSLLYRRCANELRLILVDPKRIELGMYDGIPHLLTPVITDTQQVLSALRWCVNEMESRYKAMEQLKVKSVDRYNQKLLMNDAPPDGEPPEPFPYIVLVIDEFADMMQQVGKKAEQHIVSLAQKARACGIHLILATQRPTVDVITGLIKSNIPARIAFQVSSRIDSRTILEQNGAEQLLGKGDLLYMRSAATMTERIHGPYVSEPEVEAVIGYLKQLNAESLNYEVDLSSVAPESDEPTTEPGDESVNEKHYAAALAIVKETRRVSVSYLQRRMRLGYNHAARLVDIMEKRGLVTPLSANGKREYIGPAD